MQTELKPIALPYGGGGRFHPLDLVAHLRQTGRTYIIQGQQKVPLSAHTKPQSLDYWLRQFARNPDTKQADNAVMEALERTGLFHIRTDLWCPDSGRRCKGLELDQRLL